jgi:CTP:molybdopterin cytidylyltransferase MocA
MPLAGLVLAAGAGTRFGQPKALLMIGLERFVDRTVRILAEGGAEPIFVVVGAAEVGHVDAIVVSNPQWAEGIGSSMRAGLLAVGAYARAVAPDVTVEGAVVMLVDQPQIASEAVRRVLARARSDGSARAVVATYNGVRRHPVYLGAALWDRVAASSQGDRGARQFLDQHPELVSPVVCDGIGDPADIYTVDDLARIAGSARPV